MADQGATIITMNVPASTARGTAISGAGTKSATLRSVGVLVEPTSASETKAPVQIAGTALALLGTGGATAGAPLKANASGALIAATTGAGNDDHLICAIALEAGSAGELRRVKLV